MDRLLGLIKYILPHPRQILPTWVLSNYDMLKQAVRMKCSTGNPQTPVKRQRALWNLTFLVHLIALLGALIVLGLNFKGVWIGKELQGRINQDGTKILALQLTAKLHELLMLTSLGKFLGSFLLELVVLNEGAPFGALLAGDQFSKISYLWSNGYVATCLASFNKKKRFIVMTTVCTILGILVGPSSATAMTPSLGDWPIDQIMLPINVSESSLWLAELTDAQQPWQGCSDVLQPCQKSDIWNTLASSMFEYWGHRTIGGIQAIPEFIMLPGGDALRTIHTRFRGPISLYQPDLTAATVQSASIANIITNLRMLWYRSNEDSCVHGKGLCNYKDIAWSIDTLQPVVYTACNLFHSDQQYWPLPNMTRVNGTLSTVNISPIKSDQMQSPSSFQWFEPEGTDFRSVSLAVIVRLPNGQSDGSTSCYACSIDAQWANSTVVTTFLGSPYVVDGSPPYYFVPHTKGSTYEGQRIKIRTSWAEAVMLGAGFGNNQTAFDILYNSGTVPSTDNANSKVEAILAVLMVTSMSQMHADISFDTSMLNSTHSLEWNDLRKIPQTSYGTSLQVSVIATGYAYGLNTANSFALGRFLSLLTLIAYSTIVLVCFAFRLVQRQPFIKLWDDILDLIWLTMRTSSSYQSAKGIPNITSLRHRVRFLERSGQVEMVMEPLLSQGQGFSDLQVDEIYN